MATKKKTPFSARDAARKIAGRKQQVNAAVKKATGTKKQTRKKVSSSVRKTTTESARRTKHRGAHGEVAFGQRMSKTSPINRKRK